MLLNYSPKSTLTHHCAFIILKICSYPLWTFCNGRRLQYWLGSPGRHIKETFPLTHSLWSRITQLPIEFSRSRKAESPRHFSAPQQIDLEPSCKSLTFAKGGFEYSLGPTHHTHNDLNKMKTKQKLIHSNTLNSFLLEKDYKRMWWLT